MKPAWIAIKTKARKRRFLRCSGKRRVLGCYAVYTDHINTPRLVTLVNNPLNPVPLTDTSNDLAQTSGDAIQGISPLAMPVRQMAYSPFGVDLANGYEARPTTINNNFKPDLWEWLGLPETGGAGNWSWYAGGGNGQANSSVLTAPVLNIRYPGQYYDFEIGLSQNWWRSYDARMGRYTQNDPIGLGGGMNRFGYVEGDGINYSDSMGLQAKAKGYESNSCAYYDERCKNDAGMYYCKVAPTVCAGSPDSRWTRCVRKCLQDTDKQYCEPKEKNFCGGSDLTCVVNIHQMCWQECITEGIPPSVQTGI